MIPASAARRSVLLLALVVLLAAPGTARASPAEAERLRGQAQAAMERKSYTDAEALLERAYKEDPSKPVILKDLAVVLASDGKIDAAVARYRQYLEIVPGDDAATLAMATTLSWSKENDRRAESEAVLTSYLAKHPDSDDALLQRARVRAWSSRVDAAATDYDAYLVRHPTAEDVRLELAIALSSKNDRRSLERAIAIYDAHLASHASDLAILLQRARVLSWAARPDLASRDFRAYLAQKPEDRAAWLAYADAVAQGAHPGDAIAIYDRVIASWPDVFDARSHRARTLLWIGDHRRAESELLALRASARTDAERTSVELDLARLYAQTGRRYQAQDVVEDVLARDPTNQEAAAERARIATFTGARVEPKLFAYDDKSHIQILAATVEARAPIVARRVGIIADGGTYSLGTSQETLLAARANLGAWARIGFVELEAAAGPRFYQYVEPRAGVRAAALATPTSWLNALLTYQYDDIYFDMLQPASISAGVRGHATYLTTDVTLPYRIRVTGRLGTREVLPDNKSFDASATVLVPIIDPLSVGYIAQYLTWAYNDPSYWSPQAFVAHLAVVRASQSFYRVGFGYDVQGVLGIAGERILGAPEAGYGPSFGASGAVTYTPTPRVELRVSAQYQQTIRDIPPPIVGGSNATSVPGVPTKATPSAYWWITGTASAVIYF